ncbi:hypothetical protein HYH03_016633 [Edaphochlamys debaryana]|uniref:Uncharacterized protein n=1 Tax=Edaphochlamys debaryana TaxID=47281 RepID=A0A835XH74_9CHLO|nr:hypothetical protein HYH03_016633 [Edaphochlamys debaryana]|eukprot:KAG2484592.1 hypothetical protein HYH03_016633 [Edaphochlamys debaryana]
MTVALEDDGASYRPCADDMSALPDDYDPTDAPVTTAASSVSRVPLHGPVDTHDVMCAKVIFALCGSVFPHPLLLAQQLLGIEDQDFAEFQLNVAEAGNNCIDIVAAYLTNLRTLQSEEEPNPPVSLAMIQPRHAATVASVAAKARDLLSELALARATVKPRKAPKNKAIDAAARAAAASASPAPAPAPGSGTSSSGVLSGPSANGDATTSDESDMPSDTGPAGSGEDGLGSDSNDEGSCCGADTSRDDSAAPRTAREDEERLLFALQGAGAEETLKMARALPPGCKRSEPRPSSEGQPAPVPASASTTCPGGVTPSGPASASPRAPPPPPPPPARTTSAMAQYAAGQAGPYGNGNNGNGNGRNGQEHGRNGSAQGRQAQALGQGQALSASSLQTALSCPVTGLPEVGAGTVSPPTSGPLHGPGYSGNGSGNGGSQTGMHPAPPPSHSQSGRRGGRDGGGNNQGQHGNGGRRNATATGHGGQHSSRSSPTPPPPPPVGISAAQLQQQAQHAQQQHQLAMAHLLGLSRTTQPYGNSGGPFGGNANAAAAAAYGNQLAALQGAFAGVAAAASGGLPTCYGNDPAGGAASRLDAALGGYNSMAATTAALELAAAQQALNSGFGSFGPAGGGAGGGFGAGPAGALSGLGGLAGGLGSAASGFGMGVGMGPRSGISLADQQAAAHAAALLQQGGPGLSMLSDGMKVSGAADAWSNVLLQAQLAGSLA